MLISAICVTGKTPWHVKHMLPVAISQWEENRDRLDGDSTELVLVSEEPLDSCLVRVDGVHEVVSGRVTLGELRNAGLDAAKGDVAIQWDDDDFHASDRIAVQVARFKKLGRGYPVFLQRQLCYSWTTGTAFVRQYPNTFIHGTILHANDGKFRYHPQRKGEDTAFIKNWWHHDVIDDNDPSLYVRFEHGHNTWPRNHIMRAYDEPWARGGWWLSDPCRAYLWAALGKYPPDTAASVGY